MCLSHVCRCGPLQRGEEGHHRRIFASSRGGLHRRARSRDPESDSEEGKRNSAFQLKTVFCLHVLVISLCPRRSALPGGGHGMLPSAGTIGFHRDGRPTRWGPECRPLWGGWRGPGQSPLSGSAPQPRAPSRPHALAPEAPCEDGFVSWWQAPCPAPSCSPGGPPRPILCLQVKCDF